MKDHLLLKIVVIAVLVFVAPIQILAQDPEADAARTVSTINRQTIPYTNRLVPVDEVELIRIARIGEMGDIRATAQTKSIKGRQARLIASVWRSQMWDQKYSAKCHEPPYAVKFYSGGSVVLYATICWACDNIVILQPTESGQGFNAQSRSAKTLLKFFTDALPVRK